MTKLSRTLLAVASLLMLGVFVLPLWRIELVAPQYPEGLGMLIRINTVSGIKPNDLANINGLNHYIGMKAIEPDAIPELRVMPWIVVGLVTLGLLGAALGRRSVLYVWLGSFATLALVGLYDFWRWEYDYGHNIDFEHAIIKIPGMTYQPPLIGTKQLLNFTAASWPAAGAICLGVAFALGIAALVVARRSRMAARHASIALAVAASACAAPGPRTIAYGRDTCDYCHMLITDRRFGGQLVTSKGKVHAFDSVECLAAYYLANDAAADGSHLWVADFGEPEHWVAEDQAVFARSTVLQSPMGLGIVSFDAKPDTAAIRGELHATIVTWHEVLELVRSERLADVRRADAPLASH